jgi:hypothetical protein
MSLLVTSTAKVPVHQKEVIYFTIFILLAHNPENLIYKPATSIAHPISIFIPFSNSHYQLLGYIPSLDHESLDLVLQSSDLVHQIGGFVGSDTGTDNSTRNTTSTTQSSLTWNVNVWDVLVFAEEWKVEKDSERSSVGSEDDDLTDTTVQSLRRLVCTLLELAVVGGLLDDVEDLLSCRQID